MRITFIIVLLCLAHVVFSHEGMWMPQLIKQLNEADMKANGMKLSAEDIYSINKSSLKDAIIQFGGGCTGEIISSKGLLLTNHHCGFSQIQSLSTIEKNYLQEGFWANSFAEEIPCPGLTVTFIREIIDVTNVILQEVSDTMSEESRAALIASRSDSLEKTITGTRKGVVRAFYYGNKFYLFNTEVFKDIRFVGAPPQEIGKFGGELDNWMWPRHTGDFSMFRIYADKENLPAMYSTENVPYTPKQFLTISTKGVKENDFVFIFGFPGRTFEYMLSPSLDLIERQTNVNRIEIREAKLEVLRKQMAMNDTVRLKYAAKFSTTENAYKKWQGELLGFRKQDVVENKIATENSWIDKIKKNDTIAGDTMLVEECLKINNRIQALSFANDFYVEAFPSLELVNVYSIFKPLILLANDKSKNDSAISAETQKLIKALRGFYKNFSATVDKEMCEALLTLSIHRLGPEYLPSVLLELKRHPELRKKYIDDLLLKSIVADSNRAILYLTSFKKKSIKKLLNDPAYVLSVELSTIQSKLQSDLVAPNRALNRVQRKWMADVMKLESPKKIYPDANLTLRISYGKVKAMKPGDAKNYDYYTTATGIIEKSLTGETDYKIPLRLDSLIRNKDFGKYGTKGVLPVNFIASTHTTGGNSGSPCLNAKGELVGINFDRVWEGVASDYFYDENFSRNVSVDIRYVLFLIEKYGNAKRLIEEMRFSK